MARTVDFLTRMGFDQCGHAQIVGELQQLGEAAIVQCRDDEEHQIRSMRPGFPDLVFIGDEVLAQHRNMHGLAHLVEIDKAAEESTPFRQHGDCACSPVSYSRASAAGSGISARCPLDGDARLISAMTGMESARLSHCVASSAGVLVSASRLSSSIGVRCARSCMSCVAPATRSSSTDMVPPEVVPKTNDSDVSFHGDSRIPGHRRARGRVAAHPRTWRGSSGCNERNCAAIWIASTLASALLRVSCHSLAGTESSTMPAPACTEA